MGTFRYQGADGREYFNLTAQSGVVTTSNDPEDLWPLGGDVCIPYANYNTATNKIENYYANAVVSSSSNDTLVEITIYGLDGEWNEVSNRVILNGTTEVKFADLGMVRVNNIICGPILTDGNIKVYNAEKGSSDGNVFGYLEAGKDEARSAVYTPHKKLYIQKIELLPGGEDIINNIIVYKHVSNQNYNTTEARAKSGVRHILKYIQFEKPAGQIQPCHCYEFKNPHRISVGESIFITIEEVTDSNAFRCNIEGYFQ